METMTCMRQNCPSMCGPRQDAYRKSEQCCKYFLILPQTAALVALILTRLPRVTLTRIVSAPHARHAQAVSHTKRHLAPHIQTGGVRHARVRAPTAHTRYAPVLFCSARMPQSNYGILDLLSTRYMHRFRRARSRPTGCARRASSARMAQRTRQPRACRPQTARAPHARPPVLQACQYVQWCTATRIRSLADPRPYTGFFSTPCTAARDRGACVPCTSQCPAGWSIISACNATRDMECSPCPLCGNNTYEAAPCLTSAPRVCKDCSQDCPAGSYQSAPCSAKADRQVRTCCMDAQRFLAVNFNTDALPSVPPFCLQCTTCTPCGQGENEVSPCTPTADRVCAKCSGVCANGTYQTAACTADRDQVCKACSTCTVGVSFESSTCTPTSDRVCTACSSDCPAGSFQTLPCNKTADRVCTAVWPCRQCGCARLSVVRHAYWSTPRH